MAGDKSEQVKVLLEHDPGEYESMWASPVGPQLYQLNNTPCFAYNLSAGDVVETRAEDGSLFVVSIHHKSGNRTLRADFPKDQGYIQGTKAGAVIAMLVRLGCWHERFEPRLLAIDVPATIDLHWLTDWLTAMEVDWEYGDPQPNVDGFYRTEP